MTSRHGAMRVLFISILIFQLCIPPSLLHAGGYIPGFYGNKVLTPPAANTLPQVQNIITGVESITKPCDYFMEVHQGESKAIIEWSSFDVGADAWVNFDQKGNTNWAVLNRIFDQNPSQIFGRLTAEGKVFLINPNGMLFSKGSRINAHTIAASALEMQYEDFLADDLSLRLKFAAPDEMVSEQWLEETWIVNEGQITADSGGAIHLLAPNVANSGDIEAPDGTINIVAGTDAEYTETPDVSGTQITKVLAVENRSGTIINDTDGRIQADGGDIRLIARVVNTDGLIRSVQAVNDQGTILLQAADKVQLGVSGSIETPIDDSEETFHSSFELTPGKIDIESGGQVLLEGSITAPAGHVTISVEDTEDNPGRIYMAETSHIDVAGLWVDQNPEDQLVTFQLNSVELRDDYGQKDEDGILRGATITAHQRSGSAIGNISQHLDAKETTTAERAAQGGTVIMEVNQGDIIIREGAAIDISGGGLDYQAGSVETTKLLSGNTVYDISEAPQNITYTKQLGNYRKVYERYGQVDSFEGVYYGGAVPLRDYSPAYQAGADAGHLSMRAPTIVLNGTLDGSVYVGPFQTEQYEIQDDEGENLTVGLARPAGGEVVFGVAPVATNGSNLPSSDQKIAEIVFNKTSTKLPESFGPDTSLAEAFDHLASSPMATDYYNDDRPFYRTILSTDMLNEAGLSSVEAHTVTTLSIEADAELNLTPTIQGEGFVGTARRVIHAGRIRAPSGTIKLTATVDGNYTNFKAHQDYIGADRLGPERIYLGNKSVIDVSGDCVDNVALLSTGLEQRTSMLNGGRVDLQVATGHGDGVIVEEGSLIDVSGGYEIDPDGTIKGGDAGALTIEASTVILDGDLAGHSLVDYAGGKLSLQTESLYLVSSTVDRQWSGQLGANSPMPTELEGRLTLVDSQLEYTGFTKITLKSLYDPEIDTGVVFTPSNAKLATPLPLDQKIAASSSLVNRYAVASDPPGTVGQGIVLLPDTDLGGTLISLNAGVPVVNTDGTEVDQLVQEANIFLPSDTTLAAASGGEVTIAAPNRVDVAGTVRADGGDITLSADRAVHLWDGAMVQAKGYTRVERETLVEGGKADIAVYDGGTVSIQAGLIRVDQRASIDVSAAETAFRYMPLENGTAGQVALDGHAGEVNLSFLSTGDGNELIFNGSLLAEHANRAGIGGGGLALENMAEGVLTVSQALLTPFGFEKASSGGPFTSTSIDNLTLKGATIDFKDIQTLDLTGQLSLDAREVTASSATSLQLSADLLTISNSEYTPSVQGASGGTAGIEFDGRQGAELSGHITFNGFQSVAIKTSGDLRVGDMAYQDSGFGSRYYSGGVETFGALTLTADRIYPTTSSRFGFRVGGESSNIIIQGAGNHDTAPIFSAAGQLIFAADSIFHDGVVKAPMGEIVFCGDYGIVDTDGTGSPLDLAAAQTVIFSDRSITSVTGEAVVPYGSKLAENTLSWTVRGTGSATDFYTLESAPAGAVSVESETFVAGAGATVDASGGGGIQSYRFDPGIEGTVNPLSDSMNADGRYVLLPDNPKVWVDVEIGSGEAIYVEGCDLLAEGEYALLPAEYAFLPGAVVVEDQGSLKTVSQARGVSSEGYAQMVAYHSRLGTDQQNTTPHLFTVRSAEAVRTEGYFQNRQYLAGNGGTIRLSADTNLVAARFDVTPLVGYQPGTLEASALEVLIGSQAASAALSAMDLTSSPDQFVVPTELQNKMIVQAEGLLENSQGNLKLDASESGGLILVQNGTTLAASEISLTADAGVVLADGATIDTIAGGGGIDLSSPSGQISIDESAVLRAAGEVVLDGQRIDMDGTIETETGQLTIAGDEIRMVVDAASATGVDALYITQSQWEKIASFKEVKLRSRNGLYLGENVDLALATSSLDQGQGLRTLTIDSGWIGPGGEDTQTHLISAGSEGRLMLQNSSSSLALKEVEAGGSLLFAAGDILIGDGEVRIDGFEKVQFNAGHTVAFQGKGRLESLGELNFSAFRIAAIASHGSINAEEMTYQPADFDVVSTDGRLAINASAASTTESEDLATGIGGRLAFNGNGVHVNGRVESPAGSIVLSDTGTGEAADLHIGAEAILLTEGTVYAETQAAEDGSSAYGDRVLYRIDGGEIVLGSSSGDIAIDAGALLSVSGGVHPWEDQLASAAGTIDINATQGHVDIFGELQGRGYGEGGAGGGGFSLDAFHVGELSDLAQLLEAGGFTRQIHVRSRQADDSGYGLSLASGSTLSAEHVWLAADGSSMRIEGIIDNAGAWDGGLIELYAGDSLILAPGSVIDAEVDVHAAPAEAKGAEVYLSAREGAIRFERDGDQVASINVANNDADGQGGIVYFRARRQADALILSGEITGAAQIVAEGFTAVEATSGNVSPADIQSATIGFNVDAPGWDTADLESHEVGLTVIPGIEFNHDGDITIEDDITLTNQRFGSALVPGALTIRAAGALEIAEGVNIEDRHAGTSIRSLTPSHLISTWGIKLAAGVDLDSADALAVDNSSGIFSMADRSLVYSQSAPIWFASGGDTTIASGASTRGYISNADIPANLMTYDKAIRGYTAGTLTIAGGAVQSAVGDIYLDISGDLLLSKVYQVTGTYIQRNLLGSIRTLGRPDFISEYYDEYDQCWRFSDGGSIQLQVAGELVSDQPSSQAETGWGQRYMAFSEDYSETSWVWGASYGGGLYAQISSALPTQGIAAMGGGDLTAQAGGSIDAAIGIFGQGNLKISAGRNLDGRFLTTQGNANLTALQHFGKKQEGQLTQTVIRQSQLELFDAQVAVFAAGNIKVGTILNPGVYSREFSTGFWNLGYTPDTAISFKARQGDIVYTGQSDISKEFAGAVFNKNNFLPANVVMTASRDILFQQDSMYMAPSPSGRLILEAGRTIDGLHNKGKASTKLLMSEAALDAIYGFQSDSEATSRLKDKLQHTESPLHAEDDEAVVLSSGEDIANIELILPKRAYITAGNDLYNFGLLAQTLSKEELNQVFAEHDIQLQTDADSGGITSGINSAGPGGLLVQAGNNIDLGATIGIRTTGSINNAYLPKGEGPLMIVAGISPHLSVEEIIPVYSELKAAAKAYSKAQSEGDDDKAQETLDMVESTIVPALVPEMSGEGTLNMTQSQIASLGNAGDLFIVAAGEVSVGKSALNSGGSNQNTGINAVQGGDINLFAMQDINVNESRVVSFGGGDILAWSQKGDINAGRGSKAAVSASLPRLVIERDESGSVISTKVVFDPPAVGSGIRALTFDPDGLRGPLSAPQPGDVYLVAPEGTIDAGEAGIKGNNVFLAAQEVVNAQNIDVAGASVGVPDTSGVSTSMAALAGAGTMSETSKMAEESGAAKSAADRFKDRVEELEKSLVPKWVAVEVIGFEEEKGQDNQEEEK